MHEMSDGGRSKHAKYLLSVITSTHHCLLFPQVTMQNVRLNDSLQIHEKTNLNLYDKFSFFFLMQK